MNRQEKINFKKSLQTKCIEVIEERISLSYTLIENAQSAANAEEKSSAGDKYETGRAMNQLEKEMYTKQWLANKRELATIHSIGFDEIHLAPKGGSIVKSKEFCFFILAGLGKITVAGEIVFCLSPFAPFAQILMDKKIGDVVIFNKREIIISDIY
jgi:hypothetical protein